MMKIFSNIFIFTIALLVFVSCEGIQEPEFKKFEEIEVLDLTTRKVDLAANALYFNPNDIGGTLEACQFKLYVNDVFVSDISHDLSTEIEANNDFVLPIKAEVPLDKIVNKDSGLFGQILNTLLQKKIIVKMEGQAKLKFKGLPIDLPFSRQDTVPLRI